MTVAIELALAASGCGLVWFMARVRHEPFAWRIAATWALLIVVVAQTMRVASTDDVLACIAVGICALADLMRRKIYLPVMLFALGIAAATRPDSTAFLRALLFLGASSSAGSRSPCFGSGIPTCCTAATCSWSRSAS